MTTALACAIMALADRCMGESRREWAQAMQAEFAAAIEDGHSLPFAIGCLWSALRQMPVEEEGRFVLTSYILALAVMIPMAAVQIGWAVFSLLDLFAEDEGLRATLAPGQAMLVGGAYQAALPSLTILLLLAGAGHLLIAWLMLERDWPRVISTGMAILAAMVTLVLFMGSVFLAAGQALTLIAVPMTELAVLAGLACWHAELNLPPPEPAGA